MSLDAGLGQLAHAIGAGTVPRFDHWRGTQLPLGRRGWKEWHHFVVHAPGLHLLVNFSLVDDLYGGGPGDHAHRVILLAHTDRWRGDAVRVPRAEVRLTGGGLDARFGPHQMGWTQDRYHVVAALPDGSLRVDVQLVPASIPVYSTNQTLAADRTLSWFFLSRLVATGTVEVAGERFTLDGVTAYHDHNWGDFRWGDDFCWEWASALPEDGADPWSTVLMRLTDRARTRVRAQGLFLFHHGQPVRFFRDREVRFELDGRLRFDRRLRVPRVMGLLAGGHASEVPGRVRVVGRSLGDEVQLDFEVGDLCQVIMPNETDHTGVTVLNETIGRARVAGRVRHLDVASTGPGVFEFIRG
ncbi:MAG: hypothetical protein H6732_13290 [Alphaproteobacteria bacterium]|nr:hypothetical protein [Alphaproteobacteria bacterium]